MNWEALPGWNLCAAVSHLCAAHCTVARTVLAWYVLKIDMEVVHAKDGKAVSRTLIQTRRGQAVKIRNSHYTRLVNVKSKAMRASKAVISLNLLL